MGFWSPKEYFKSKFPLISISMIDIFILFVNVQLIWRCIYKDKSVSAVTVCCLMQIAHLLDYPILIHICSNPVIFYIYRIEIHLTHVSLLLAISLLSNFLQISSYVYGQLQRCTGLEVQFSLMSNQCSGSSTTLGNRQRVNIVSGNWAPMALRLDSHRKVQISRFTQTSYIVCLKVLCVQRYPRKSELM